jgi:hypothetical protein
MIVQIESPASSENVTPASNSIVVWLILVAYMILVKLILDAFLPNAFADPSQASLFGWVPLGIFSVAGLIGVGLSQRTGFPNAWDPHISLTQRILYPGLIGVIFGLLQIGLDLSFGFTEQIAARHGVAQQYTDFPSMFLIFTAAPIIVEVVYRLLLVPLLLWLISNVMLKGKAQNTVFWILAVITSLLEPLSQFPDLQILPAALMSFLVLEYFAINLTQAYYFRKSGFLASIIVRLGFYLVWHVIYVH